MPAYMSVYFVSSFLCSCLANEMLVKRYPNKTPDLDIHRSSAPSAIHSGEPRSISSPIEAGTPQSGCTGKHIGPIERHDGPTGAKKMADGHTRMGAAYYPQPGTSAYLSSKLIRTVHMYLSR